MKNLKIIDKIVLIIVSIILICIITLNIIDNWENIPNILGVAIYTIYMTYVLLHLGLLLPSLYLYHYTIQTLEKKYPEAKEYSDGLFEAIAWLIIILPHIIFPTVSNMLINGSWDILDNIVLFSVKC